MSFAPVPSHLEIQAALRTALLAILPDGVEVIEGQDNNVAEPPADFVVMTVIRRERISTNVDTYQDCKFQGSISNGLLTIAQTTFGTLSVGNPIFGTGITPTPTITAINPDGSVWLSAPITLDTAWLASGVKQLRQSTRVVFQLDVHSEDMGRASDMAQTISTVMRDDVGYLLLKQSGLPLSPLYADDPRQMPFQNAENNTEDRYVIEVHLQADQVITPPQEFADQVIISRLPADVFYPA